MEYRGIEYSVVQILNERGAAGHGGWKWSVRFDPFTSASGTEHNRVAAIVAVEKKIDHWLRPLSGFL
jgi:hypothetical protein